MSTPITTNTTVIGVMEEVTEGTYVAPAAATDYVLALQDGFELTPSKELVERDVLDASIGKVTPRVGQKSVSASLGLEMRAKGVEGGDPQYGPLMDAALGAKHQITTQTTTKAVGNTGAVLQIQDADISDFQVGDIIVVLEPGAHHVCAVESVDSTLGAANIGIVPNKPSGSFSASVVISKSTTYYPANTGHPTLSLSYYWGNEILQKALGTRVTSMALENFTTGQIANWNFGLEGLNFDEIDGSAPHTPSFDSALPPLILRACLFQNDTELQINEFSFSVENTVGFMTSTCSSTGRVKSRVTERSVSGSFNPYKDDTSVDQYTKFNTNEAYSLFVSAYNPSSVAGEIELGSVVGVYLPVCITTEKSVTDLEGLLVESLTFSATRGNAGTTNEVYIGFV